MIISIVPVPAYPLEAVSLRVDDGAVTLGVGANFQALLLDASGNPASIPTRIPLTDEQYTAWTGDDLFVAECVAWNMGLTPIVDGVEVPAPTPAPTPEPDPAP